MPNTFILCAGKSHCNTISYNNVSYKNDKKGPIEYLCNAGLYYFMNILLYSREFSLHCPDFVGFDFTNNNIL